MNEHSDTVRTLVDGRIGVIVVDNPPVNAIAPSVRSGIDAAARELASDSAVDAIVLHCAGSSFMAGADIRKLADGLPSRPTAEIIASLEAVEKPVVAVLHGNALGGGLEFALGCHFRCAHEGTRLGLPEVNLGLIPGAGGTQRLPRLVGIAKALDLICNAKLVDASEALRIGLVDRVVDATDMLAAGIGYTRELLSSRAPLRRTSRLPVPPDSQLETTLVDARAALNRARRGEQAPLKAVEAVRAAATLSWDEGIAVEARLFAECRESSQSRALRHLFLAERQVAKVRGVAPDTPTRAIARVGVLGGGTMGRGIAVAFANAGLPVTLVELDTAALDRTMTAIAELYAAGVAKGRMSAAESDARRARIKGRVELRDFADADLVIEAVFEDLPLKQRIFAELDAICDQAAVLASNTSALSIDRIAEATRRPEQVVGLHFFSPAHVMRLVEIVRGSRTDAGVIATAMRLVKSLGKIGVVAGNCDGFIGNRMLAGYRRETEFLLLEGASPAQVDRALCQFGMPMGPLAMGDMAGLDIGAATRRRRRAEGTAPSDPRFAVISDRLVELGRLGQKTGAGFYRYEPGSREAVPDPDVDRIIERESLRLGVPRRTIEDGEIVERCVYPLINEAAKILDEGIAQRPGDIDVVWVNGYGFPRTRGGPMQFADEIGLPLVLETLRRFESTSGSQYWKPASLIERLVHEGRPFGSLNDA